MRKFVFFFFLIIYQISFIFNIIVLPIEVKIKTKKNIDDPDEYYLYTKLNIGEPIQEIDCEINFEISDYYMTNYPSNVIPRYNISLSRTIEKTETMPILTSKFSDGYLAHETIYVFDEINCKNEKKIENMNFVMPYFSSTIYACEIGFQSRHSDKMNAMSFIHELKKNNIVDNYIWTLKLDNLNEGLLIIGAAPHEYDKNYKESELRLINSFSENSKPYWSLSFKFDPSNTNYKMNQNIIVYISPKIYGVITSYYYLQIIEENFFKKYYSKNICERIIISFEKRNYFKIICSKEKFTTNDIESFPPLKLYNIALNYTFILEGKDVFRENEEKYELEIISEINSIYTEWKLGRIFLKKYQIIFDDDNGLIGFYRPNLFEANEKNNKMSNGLKIGILFVVGSIFIFLSFLIYKKINIIVKRKKMANELEDDFMYISKNNKEKNINI